MNLDVFTVFPTISTSFIVISAVLVAIGWWQIIKGKRNAHKKTMIAAAVAALIFFIVYMSRTVFIGNTSWGGPDDLKVYYQVFLIFHIVLATVAAVFGITTLVLGFKEKYAKHRKWGRVTAVIWFITAITGVAVYVLLYLLYPGGHTKPVWEVILGA
ncbi:putative membrane protein [Fontibacillus panacisegetis]|uniref:Putative membrane protein n=1 Tax=Fontibacillus panacisegetis TaxID=670482 RepID=A0A1G7SAJ1_9BACL|nr:putative membrane protein [Fontibacillus panacisegetis]